MSHSAERFWRPLWSLDRLLWTERRDLHPRSPAWEAGVLLTTLRPDGPPDRNRTGITSLENWRSAIELRAGGGGAYRPHEFIEPRGRGASSRDAAPRLLPSSPIFKKLFRAQLFVPPPGAPDGDGSIQKKEKPRDLSSAGLRFQFGYFIRTPHSGLACSVARLPRCQFVSSIYEHKRVKPVTDCVRPGIWLGRPTVMRAARIIEGGPSSRAWGKQMQRLECSRARL